MAKPLLERQVSLIAHLTSSAAIFGGGEGSAADFEGIDRTLLRVEAGFSYAKRMDKITAVLPRTFELLGSNGEKYKREFVESCPPTTLSRLENACQFHRFLVSWWKREAPDPPYICDVADLEIARAKVDADPEHQSCGRAMSADRVRCGSIRRRPHVILLRCAYDIRPLFEAPSPILPRPHSQPSPASGGGKGGGRGEGAVPVKRDTPLLVAMPPGADGPQVFDVVPPMFDLLTALHDWTDSHELPSDAQFAKLLADLTAQGLIEVRP
jgi:hypothetical protein